MPSIVITYSIISTSPLYPFLSQLITTLFYPLPPPKSRLTLIGILILVPRTISHIILLTCLLLPQSTRALIMLLSGMACHFLYNTPTVHPFPSTLAISLSLSFFMFLLFIRILFPLKNSMKIIPYFLSFIQIVFMWRIPIPKPIYFKAILEMAFTCFLQFCLHHKRIPTFGLLLNNGMPSSIIPLCILFIASFLNFPFQ